MSGKVDTWFPFKWNEDIFNFYAFNRIIKHSSQICGNCGGVFLRQQRWDPLLLWKPFLHTRSDISRFFTKNINQLKIASLPVCPVKNDSFSEVDFTKVYTESAVYIMHQQQYYDLAVLLQNNDVYSLREEDTITITCQSGNIV